MSELEVKQEESGNRHLIRDIIISVFAFAITIGLLVWTGLNWNYVDSFRQFGYLGLFILGILTGAVSFIPIPGLLAVFSLGSILIPPFVGLAYGLGEATGSMLIYFEGYSGSHAIKKINNRVMDKMEQWLREHGAGTVLVMSALINPFYLPFTALAGMMRYGVVKFFLLCFIGKSIKNIIIAYLGFFGLGSLLKLIGVPV